MELDLDTAGADLPCGYHRQRFRVRERNNSRMGDNSIHREKRHLGLIERMKRERAIEDDGKYFGVVIPVNIPP